MALIRTIPFDQIERVECTYHKPAVTIDKADKGADIVINAPLFDMSTGKILTRFTAGGVDYGPAKGAGTWANTWGIGFNPLPVKTWDNGINAPHFVGPYSFLVVDGEIRDGLGESAKRGRTAIGLTDNAFVVYVVPDNASSSDKCSTATLAQRMRDMGCHFAINLDGGLSSQYIAHGHVCKSSRPVPGYIHIWLKKEEPKQDNPVPKEANKMTGEKLVELCKAQVGSGYVWGGLGYTLTEARLNQLKSLYPSVYTSAYLTKAKALMGKKVYDCVGLIKHFLWGNTGDGVLRHYATNGIPDTTANGILNICPERGSMNTFPGVPGVMVHMDGHVGVYIGNGEVVEARGIDYGVVITKLTERPWKNWGKLPGVEYTKPATVPKSITWAELAAKLRAEGYKMIDL